MTKRHRIIIALGCMMMVLTNVRLAFAQAVCANASGTWSAGATVLSIVQTGKAIGSVKLTTQPAGTCHQSVGYEGTGSWSDGSVSMAVGIQLNGVAPPGCASTITLSGSIHGGGCDQLSGTWFNSGSNFGTFAFSLPAPYKPAEASAATQQWIVPSPLPSNAVDNAPTIAMFEQTLSGSVPNFGGRTIAETFPDVSGDSCHFPSSYYPSFIPQKADPFVLDVQSNNQYQDQVGADAEVINYYRYFQRAPCDFTTTQVMTIGTDSGSESYATNSMDIHIDPITLTSTRTPTASQSETWGETQAQWQTQKNVEQVIVSWLLVHGI